MTNQNQSLPEYPNSLCRILGHRWQKTTSDTYRLCDRNGCHATERFAGGAWIPVEQRPRSKRTVIEPVATLF